MKQKRGSKVPTPLFIINYCETRMIGIIQKFKPNQSKITQYLHTESNMQQIICSAVPKNLILPCDVCAMDIKLGN